MKQLHAPKEFSRMYATLSSAYFARSKKLEVERRLEAEGSLGRCREGGLPHCSHCRQEVTDELRKEIQQLAGARGRLPPRKPMRSELERLKVSDVFEEAGAWCALGIVLAPAAMIYAGMKTGNRDWGAFLVNASPLGTILGYIAGLAIPCIVHALDFVVHFPVALIRNALSWARLKRLDGRIGALNELMEQIAGEANALD